MVTKQPQGTVFYLNVHDLDNTLPQVQVCCTAVYIQSGDCDEERTWLVYYKNDQFSCNHFMYVPFTVVAVHLNRVTYVYTIVLVFFFIILEKLV